MTRLRQFSEAIAHMEGFYLTAEQAARQNRHWPTIPQRFNNPGDLIFAHQHGAVPKSVIGIDGKTRVYCAFATIEDGFQAEDFQVKRYAERGCTVQETIRKWAPADDGNNPGSYTSGVCRMFGCAPDDFLTAVIAEPVSPEQGGPQ